MKYTIMVFAAAVHLLTINFAFAQETAGAVLAKLVKLPPEARQKALVDGARAEKQVTFYSSLQLPQVEPFAHFSMHHPFSKSIPRISGSKVVRIQSEMNAKVLSTGCSGRRPRR
jgi:hypothetical protein